MNMNSLLLPSLAFSLALTALTLSGAAQDRQVTREEQQLDRAAMLVFQRRTAAERSGDDAEVERCRSEYRVIAARRKVLANP